MSSASDLGAAYRTTELRLRVLLLGDGVDTPGLVRGDEQRRLVTAEVRRLRAAFDALLALEDETRTKSAEGVSAMEEELRRIASLRSRPDATQHALLTPAEAAEVLRISPASLY